MTLADLLHGLGHALLLALGMAWKTGWSLVLGFTISGALQALVPVDAIRDRLGRPTVRAIALATAAGAASSSCSYASAAITRTLFRKGAALAPSLAFLFASTNLVIELGLILWLLMGWPFAAAEWVGGVVLVIVMSLLVRLTAPDRMVEAARRHAAADEGHAHEAAPVEGGTVWERLQRPATRVAIARNVAMDVSMLWKDVVAGFVIAGLLATFVPAAWWQHLFLAEAPGWARLLANAALGPVIAMVSFVCSIGNVPMAAVLWGSGIGFGGVLAFLYADLIVLPLLDAYRRAFGWRMAAYMLGVFYVTMVIAALLVDLAFGALGWIPAPDPHVRAEMTRFRLDYTFWLNLAFGALALWLAVLARGGGAVPAHGARSHS